MGIIESPIDEGWKTWMRLRDALKANDVVMLQGDRVMPGQRGVMLPFLGGHLEFPPGPVKLALASGAPIVPVFAIPDGRGGSDVYVEDAIEVKCAVDVESAQRRLASVIERHITKHPELWLMLRPAWAEDQSSNGESVTKSK